MATGNESWWVEWKKRLHSFDSLEVASSIKATSASVAGFELTSASPDVLTCSSCGLAFSGFDRAHNHLAYHRLVSKRCSYLHSISHLYKPAPEESEFDDLKCEEAKEAYRRAKQAWKVIPEEHIKAIITPLSPIRNDLKWESERMATFHCWTGEVAPRALAQSGLVYLQGTQDTVKCVFCGWRKGGWEGEMIPDKVHCKESPNCVFMRGSATSGNIPDSLAEIFDEGMVNPPALLPSADVLSPQNDSAMDNGSTDGLLRKMMLQRAVITVLYMPNLPYGREEVKTTLIDYIQQGGRELKYCKELVQLLEARREVVRTRQNLATCLPPNKTPGRTSTSSSEPVTMTSGGERVACLLCSSTPPELKFIPCGHIVFCRTCYNGLWRGTDCPVCGVKIQAVCGVSVPGENFNASKKSLK